MRTNEIKENDGGNQGGARGGNSGGDRGGNRGGNAVSGRLLINKPAGISSFQALYPVKKALGTKKVGHTGTLDKFASGLLIVLAGKALKSSSFFTGLDKKYLARIKFGEETDTLDPEGAVIAAAEPPPLEVLQKILPQFSGKIMQKPPKYSALHINGKRAYRLAREGKEPEMKEREVEIFSLELLSYEQPFASLAVHCSSGTYIRALARDIALAASSRAHLDALVRTAIADYKLEDAIGLDDEEIIRSSLRE